MSDQNSRDREDPTEGGAGKGAKLPSGPDSVDDELDEGAIEQAMADARRSAEGPYTPEEVGLRNKMGWGRSPILSVVVIVVGLYLLVSTFADFRYFLRVTQAEPRDLGRVGDIYSEGEFSESFDNEWVRIEGEPDVQHAARMQTRDGWIGFLRLIDADASLFVSIPRATEAAPAQFPGRFEGRMRRLSASPMWEKLQQFIDAEEIVDAEDLEPNALVSAIASGSSEVARVRGGSVTLAPDSEIAVVAEFPVGIAQLGRGTWKTQEEAEQAVAALGLPWAPLEGRSKTSTMWQFVVHLGDQAGPDKVLELTKQLNGGREVMDPDPKQGALVLPRRVTFVVPFGELAVEGEQLSLPYDDNSPDDTGWIVSGTTLEKVAPVAGRLRVPAARLSAARLQTPLRADPEGYLIMSEQRPIDVWPSALMFVAVLGIVGLNVWTLVATLRRRRAG